MLLQQKNSYSFAEEAKDHYHGVSKFNVKTGEQEKSSSKVPSYTKVFADTLIQHAKKDSKIVAITAAMPDGTGLSNFRKEFPDRTFDVGIAEQHAVTFAAGLATENYKPYAAIYSTFLQRAYDQVVHDVAIQSSELQHHEQLDRMLSEEMLSKLLHKVYNSQSLNRLQT